LSGRSAQVANPSPTRCPWAGDEPLMQAYHDDEWGVPVHDDRTLFEFLCLEGAQAGLSWRTILLKRAHYRKLFHDFDIARVAAMDDAELARVLADPGIVRNRLKVNAVRTNAVAARDVIARDGSLGQFLWSLAGGKPQRNHFRTPAEVPATTPVAERMSRELKRRGFRFIGPTICYAFMQAVGMVDDHLVGCFRHSCART
jgi:DNA-3-methyladenine glycosylase I